MPYSDSAPQPIGRLVEAFQRLPGIGPKSAQRITYHLISMKREECEELAAAASGVKESLIICKQCMNVSEKSICNICDDSQRDQTTICVVEEPLNVIAIERSRSYNGLFHVLHGVISPVQGIGPEDLKISELITE